VLLGLVPVPLPAALGWLSFERSLLFTDSVLLFADATMKSPSDPKPVYHLGRSLMEVGRDQEAMLAFREALRRAGTSKVSEHRSAANGLAGLLARRGQMLEAEQVLREARLTFPRDPKLTANLAKLLRASNRAAEADQLERALEKPHTPVPRDPTE
jgi:Flp pilus assembly protein TadD